MFHLSWWNARIVSSIFNPNRVYRCPWIWNKLYSRFCTSLLKTKVCLLKVSNSALLKDFSSTLFLVSYLPWKNIRVVIRHILSEISFIHALRNFERSTCHAPPCVNTPGMTLPSRFFFRYFSTQKINNFYFSLFFF